jgi:hypothetical protein
MWRVYPPMVDDDGAKRNDKPVIKMTDTQKDRVIGDDGSIYAAEESAVWGEADSCVRRNDKREKLRTKW